MDFLKSRLKFLSNKYKLNFKSFKFVKKNFFFKKFITIYYGHNQYLFKIAKINNEKVMSNFFFPYFISIHADDLENWIESISLTNKKKVKLLTKIDDGKDLRDKFKKKFRV